MSSFLFKSILFRRFSVRNLVHTMNPNACYSLRWFSVRSKKHSFTVSYLINSLGFSRQSALSASKIASFRTRDKPDKAIEFLRNFGFNQTQISKLVRSFPCLLIIHCEKTILPKLEFLESKGVSRPRLTKSLSLFPTVLGLSLSKRIIPTFDLFKKLFESDNVVVEAFVKHPNILVDKPVRPNIAILEEHGVPKPNIATLFRRHPTCFMVSSDKFRNVVDEVVAMGFGASRANFVLAVSALRALTKSNWDAKVDLYKKWGWSHQEFLEAFERQPNCMKVSEEKISACMDFLTNQMGWSSQSVVKYPLTISLSLEKRVIPRCLVFQLLRSKGLAKKEVALGSLLLPPEKKFLEKFVTAYEDKEAHGLLKFYEEKMKLSNRSSKTSKVSTPTKEQQSLEKRNRIMPKVQRRC